MAQRTRNLTRELNESENQNIPLHWPSQPLSLILFRIYGSSSNWPADHDNGTPLVLHGSARISLTPCRGDTSDSEYSPIGLLTSSERLRTVFKVLIIVPFAEDQELRQMLFECGCCQGSVVQLSRVVSPAVTCLSSSSPPSSVRFVKDYEKEEHSSLTTYSKCNGLESAF